MGVGEMRPVLLRLISVSD